MIETLHDDLAKITGFAACSGQPNSGAQGEYAGLLCIRGYHLSRNDGARNVCIIPVSAHGTNPASAVLAGMKVVVVKSDAKGNIDIEDLRAKVCVCVCLLIICDFAFFFFFAGLFCLVFWGWGVCDSV